ncbi:MAG: PDZ domain-containing protein [Planctomycetota bacterium]
MQKVRRLLVLFTLGVTCLVTWAATAGPAAPAHASDKTPAAAVRQTAPDAQAAAGFAPGFLGVAVAEAPAPVGLDFPRTVLVVSAVQPGSPADLAGLRSGDTLLKLDDQWLLHPQQFIRLVGDTPAGSQMTATVRRGGEDVLLAVTLGERPAELAQQPQPMRLDRAVQPDPFGRVDLFPDEFADMQQRMDEQMRQMREQLEQFRQGLQLRPGVPGGNPGIELDLGPDAPFGELLPGLGEFRGQSVVVRDDGEHRLRITTNADGRHLHATDAAGGVLFDGPIDTPEQLDAVPDEVRRKVPTALPGEPEAPRRDSPPAELAV